MYKWILGVVIGLSIFVCFVVIKYGLRPKPIPIIKASNFEDPAKLGTYIYRQLFQKLNASSVIVFGLNNTNNYQLAVANSVQEILKQEKEERKESLPEFIFLSSEESYSNSPATKIEDIRKKYSNFISFTFVDLKDIQPASEILDCEKDHTYNIWLNCIQQQKVRQMLKARKVDVNKPVAIVENQSQKDIMVYIRP